MNIDESTTNSQITDSVTQANTSNIGQAPAATQGLLDAVMADTIGMGMHNAVTAQQSSQMVGGAAVAATCARLIQSRSTIVVAPPTPIPPIPPPPPAPNLAKEVAEGQVAEQQIINDFFNAIQGSESLIGAAKEELEKLFPSSSGSGSGSGSSSSAASSGSGSASGSASGNPAS